MKAGIEGLGQVETIPDDPTEAASARA